MADLTHLIQRAMTSWAGAGGVVASALRVLGLQVGAWVLVGVAQRTVRAPPFHIASRMDDRQAVTPSEHAGLVVEEILRCARRETMPAAFTSRPMAPSRLW